eukprot:352239-Chlamydomonas_euryale.AAC.8
MANRPAALAAYRDLLRAVNKSELGVKAGKSGMCMQACRGTAHACMTRACIFACLAQHMHGGIDVVPVSCAAFSGDAFALQKMYSETRAQFEVSSHMGSAWGGHGERMGRAWGAHGERMGASGTSLLE